MKRILACSLLLGIYGCQRICGDLRAVAETEPTSGAGAGGDSAGGDGGVTAGDGGAPVAAGNGPGGMPSEGGSSAGGGSGATSGDTCSPPADAHITDFDEDPPSLALGAMMTDVGGPDGNVVSEMSNKVYRENGNLPDQGVSGFIFKFNACVDASAYAGIKFEVRGNVGAGVDVSILPKSASEPDRSQPFDATSLTVCVPFAGDQKTVEELRFSYAPRGKIPDVSFSLDNFVFYEQGQCSGT